MGKTTKIILALACVFTLVFFASATVRVVKEVQFDKNCGQYIQRAAIAGNAGTAKEELKKAISYAEENALTEGNTSVIVKNQPRNDIGFWYKNLIENFELLETLENSTVLEQSNELLKVKESLTYQGESGEHVRVPEGISVYPNNAIYFWTLLISCCLSMALWLMFGIAWIEEWD